MKIANDTDNSLDAVRGVVNCFQTMKKIFVSMVSTVVLVMLGFGCGDDTGQQNTSSTTATTQPQQSDEKGQTQPAANGIAYMDSFLGETNFCIPSDYVISMKTESLKFQLYGKTYNYSGHYAVMLNTPRKHRNPGLGFGTPEKAKLVLIEDFGGDAMPLQDATIWEKSSGFIDVEALGKEWIYSGSYSIQN